MTIADDEPTETKYYVGVPILEPSTYPEWCGACATPERQYTVDEAAELIMLAYDAVANGEDALQVLLSLAWPTEKAGRRTMITCTCPPPSPPGAPAHGFYVYRLFDAHDRLVYVGSSRALKARLRAHGSRLGEVFHRATWDEYPDAATMLAAERQAITAELPALNIVGV